MFTKIKNTLTSLGRKIVMFLGYVWAAPATLLALFFIGLPGLFRQVSYNGFNDGAIEFLVREGTWLASVTNGWAGFTIGWVIIYTKERWMKNEKIRKHERAHVRQQLILGPLQPVLYGLFSIFIWIAMLDSHPYYDNPFEIDARRYAGEAVTKRFTSRGLFSMWRN